MEEEKKLNDMLAFFINENLDKIIISHARKPESGFKVIVRPISGKDSLFFQAEEFIGKQVFHKNMDKAKASEYIEELIMTRYGQIQIMSALGTASVLSGKRGNLTIKIKKNAPERIRPVSSPGRHNKEKSYILKEGIPVPFLCELGVMTEDGRVVRAKYDKFRQINRFLEFVEDILPVLDTEKENVIIDFGCGKSYLTFAVYYYLHELKKYNVKIIGLDLKKDVIEHCNKLSRDFGYDALNFFHGDIADYEWNGCVDVVMTLHACDTATDYALAKAVSWNAKVILSVPCCQHELNGQIKNDLFAPVFHYGIIKERMAALYTDTIRAQLLEYRGYKTQILEFIDMEHTPKNLLIRAVRTGNGGKNLRQIQDIIDFLHVDPTLYHLLAAEDQSNDNNLS